MKKRIRLPLNLQKGGCALSAIQHQRLLLLAEQSDTSLLLDLPVEVVAL